MAKSVEDTYKKYTQIEHVLARPGMYVGEISTITSEQWILNNEKDKLISKFVRWNPGIYKLFDEIITNAADESQRNFLFRCSMSRSQKIKFQFIMMEQAFLFNYIKNMVFM